MLKKLILSLLFVGTLLNATPPSEATVTRLYIATFDRAPDSAGLSYWLNDSGLDLEGIATSFFDQEETEAKYPSGFSHADFIEEIYENLFARGADSDGFEYWHGELEGAKVGRSVFILAVINGALGDDAKILSNKTKVGLAFVKAGRDDIDEAKEIMIPITADTSTVNPTLCKHTLSGCYIAPIVEEEKEEEEETTTSTSGGSSGGSSGGGAVVPPANTAPTANAGADQVCALLDTATPLDGSASSDSDTGDTLTYAWSVTDKPDGSKARLSDETTVTPSFTPDEAGIYTISLIVNDGDLNSIADTMTIDTSIPATTVTHKTIDYGLVCSPHTGKVWLDRNLGATQVCTAYNDSDCYGDYYQWGRNADGHEKSNSTTEGAIVNDTADLNNAGTEFIKSASDWASVDQDPATLRIDNWSATDGSSVCPADYRVPTKEELEDETTLASPAVNNRDDAYESFLRLPSAGSRYNSSGSLGFQGSGGYLWSASVAGSYSWYLGFDSFGVVWSSDDRASGQAVRCLRD